MEIPTTANPRLRRSRFVPDPQFILLLLLLLASGNAFSEPQAPHQTVLITVADENGVAIPGAQVTVTSPGLPSLQLWTDYAGQCTFRLPKNPQPYQVTVQKPGFYQSSQSAVDPGLVALRVTIAHEQIVKEQVNVTASPPGINVQQVSNAQVMNTPEIVNIPYPTSRDIRYLLPFNPGVVEGANHQVHVAGSDTGQTLDTLDGFNIRSPFSGSLDMRISADAVRTIDIESTRYPVQFGRTTGGIIAFYTGMGDNRFRFNATNFVPSFHNVDGYRFDKIVPRFTFSGPLLRNHAWFVDGLELEYDNIYIAELPKNANTDTLIRGSNLFKIQTNFSPNNILTAGVLGNDYHSPYDGISSLTPQVSTTNHDIISWLPYAREQLSFHNGALLDVGFADMRFRDGYEPHGSVPFEYTPELSRGSYFENLTGRAQRIEANANLYLPALHWKGEHSLQAGMDFNHIGYDENSTRSPVSYLREDGSLLRQSTFASVPPFALHKVTVGTYLQDRWQTKNGFLVEPGLRFDWNEIAHRPEFSPRIAAVYSPPGRESSTKFSAGIGLYYGRTQLEYLARAHTGARTDTYYNSDGITPSAPSQRTIFAYTQGLLRDPHALNWSLAIEQKLPGSIYAGADFLQKRTTNIFSYVNQNSSSALAGTYLLTNQRVDHYNSVTVQARRLFANGYTLFGAYTHSYAQTNSAVDYMPDPSPIGPQQSGPLPWDVPNRVLSWGWLPFDLPWFKRRWDFVYTMEWHTGVPITSVDEARNIVGTVGSHRYPDYVNFSPGLEWKFHFRGQYWGLRGVMENATGSNNPAMVNNVFRSPQYLTFSQYQGRAITARIRLIGTRK